MPTQIVIGALDHDLAEVAPSRGGADQLARAKSLRDASRALGAQVDFDVVAGMHHDSATAVSSVLRFIGERG